MKQEILAALVNYLWQARNMEFNIETWCYFNGKNYLRNRGEK